MKKKKQKYIILTTDGSKHFTEKELYADNVDEDQLKKHLIYLIQYDGYTVEQIEIYRMQEIKWSVDLDAKVKNIKIG